MVSEIYSDGTLMATTRVMDNGDRGAVEIHSIKDGEDVLIEELQFSKDQEKKRLKECYFLRKQVFIKQGFVSYDYGNVCIRLDNDGIELALNKKTEGVEYFYIPINKVVDFLFVEMSVARNPPETIEDENMEFPLLAE